MPKSVTLEWDEYEADRRVLKETRASLTRLQEERATLTRRLSEVVGDPEPAESVEKILPGGWLAWSTRAGARVHRLLAPDTPPVTELAEAIAWHDRAHLALADVEVTRHVLNDASVDRGLALPAAVGELSRRWEGQRQELVKIGETLREVGVHCNGEFARGVVQLAKSDRKQLDTLLVIGRHLMGLGVTLDGGHARAVELVAESYREKVKTLQCIDLVLTGAGVDAREGETWTARVQRLADMNLGTVAVTDVQFPAETAAAVVRLEEELRQKDRALREVRLERDNWKASVELATKNEAYFRGLVDEIGELFGTDARIADDGTVGDGILRAKVPELVKALAERLRDVTVDTSKWQEENLAAAVRGDGNWQCGKCAVPEGGEPIPKHFRTCPHAEPPVRAHDAVYWRRRAVYAEEAVRVWSAKARAVVAQSNDASKISKVSLHALNWAGPVTVIGPNERYDGNATSLTGDHVGVELKVAGRTIEAWFDRETGAFDRAAPPADWLKDHMIHPEALPRIAVHLHRLRDAMQAAVARAGLRSMAPTALLIG